MAVRLASKKCQRKQRYSATQWWLCLVGSGILITGLLQFLFVSIWTETTTINAGSDWWKNHQMRSQFLESPNNQAFTLDQDPLQWLLLSSSPLASLLRSSPSLKLLLQHVLEPPAPPLQPSIETCRRFPDLFGTPKLRTTKRRIFLGALLADDSWHVLGADALEARDLYHGLVFVESNRTQSFHPRPWRFLFSPNSESFQLLQNHVYGTSKVRIVPFVNENPQLTGLHREHAMRARILHEWKAMGMQPQDIGVLHDPDELLSRELLQALAWCETHGPKLSPAWQGLPNETCRSPMVSLVLPMWEGSPNCLVHSPGVADGLARWARTSMVVGACIEGIGTALELPKDARNTAGNRHKGYGDQFDYSKIPHGIAGQYPRYNANDFRHLKSDKLVYGGAGYHLHNFFQNEQAIRFKYGYFGHKHPDAVGQQAIPLGALNADLNLMVRCARGADDSTSRKRRHPLGLKALNHSLPVAFQIPGYISSRHDELAQMVQSDEAQYGRADGYDGHHLYNETNMLTHKGQQHQKEIDSKP